MSDAAEPTPAKEHVATEQPADRQSATDARAEELVDRAGERLGHFATLVSQRVQWAVARVREEAEDIWAEAQNIRNKRP